MDCLLSDTYTEADTLIKVEIFIKAVLRLIVTWLVRVPQLSKTMEEVEALPMLFLIDPNAAILETSTELMETLGKLFGTCMRGLRFFSFYDKDQISPAEIIKEVEDEKSAVMPNSFGVVV